MLDFEGQSHEEEVKACLWNKKKAGKKEYPTKGFDLTDVVKEDEGDMGRERYFKLYNHGNT